MGREPTSMTRRLWTFLCFVSLAAAPLPARAQAKLNFSRDIHPILSNNCFPCHGPDEKARKGKLRLDTKDGAFEKVVVPGKPEASTLVQRITSADPQEAMPPAKSGKKLTPREVEVLTRWVKEGAN